jgi:hypothetical protein
MGRDPQKGPEMFPGIIMTGTEKNKTADVPAGGGAL